MKSTLSHRSKTSELEDAIASVQQWISNASDIVAPVWPLKSMVAVNPLRGLEQLPFEQAILESDRCIQGTEQEGCTEASVNRELIKWCIAFFDEGVSALSMPGRAEGFYRAFRDLAPFDRCLTGFPHGKQVLESLPDCPALSIWESLDRLSVPTDKREEFLRSNFAALPGWAGYVKWTENWQSAGERSHRPASLAEFAAVRLVLKQILPGSNKVPVRPKLFADTRVVELESREQAYRSSLMKKLESASMVRGSKDSSTCKAQLVFCIDVRSEPIRRAIELHGEYETFGAAGFFGLPIRWKRWDQAESFASCPVLVKPRHVVQETPKQLGSPRPWFVRSRQQLREYLTNAYRSLKYSFATPFSLVEIAGPWFGVRMAMRSWKSTVGFESFSGRSRVLRPEVAGDLNLDAMVLAEQVDIAESALKTMGLVKGFASLVVFCGHGASTVNNAFSASLDCGACGGRHGGGNARALAMILNRDDVRQMLSERGLAIPDATLFVAASHNTTTDQVTLYRSHDTPLERRSDIEDLQRELDAALERCNPSRQSRPRAFRRSCDWSEVRPEWGLARNAAFLVGPRTLTREMDLEGRCFLHSYDWNADPTGEILASILTAPMVVAHWINSQYLFSTLDPVRFGAGSKVTHTVVGKMGVMQGNCSDLMHGLPLQSVFASDNRPYHEPLRLQSIIYAPATRIESIVRSQEILRRLIGNGWVHLLCMDPNDRCFYRLARDFRWIPIESTGESSAKSSS